MAIQEGLHRGEISDILNISLKYKSLQRRLAELVSDGKVTIKGIKRGTKYFPTQPLETNLRVINNEIFSPISQTVLKILEKPLHTRERVSYSRDFLESYVPNKTIYVPIESRDCLRQEGKIQEETVMIMNHKEAICS